MTILGSKGIEKAIDKGYIFIYPYIKEHINPNSVDLTLGNWFIRQNETKSTISLISDTDEQNIWDEPQFVMDNQLFTIRPHEFILAHTREIAGAYTKYTTLLKARSTLARCGIEICCSAGFGDVGFVNHWALEIKNQTNKHIYLQPQMRVCQLAFFKIEGEDKYNPYHGSYVQRFDARNGIEQNLFIEENEKVWSPYDIIPKLGYEKLMTKEKIL